MARHRGGEKKQSGADFQMSRVGCGEIDVESDTIRVEMEADHPPFGEKGFGFAYGQDRLTAQVPQDSRLPGAFVMTEKEDVAAGDRLRLAEQTDVQHALADEFALQCGLEFVSLRVVFEHAEVEGTISLAVGINRPVHKLREVEEKRGLYLIFLATGLPTNALRCSRNKQEKEENRA
jgi:hypothetical protein